MTKPILIGMNNPVNVGVGYELYPSPEGCTGHRLWRMLNERTGASRSAYLDAFERRNLVRHKLYDRTIARLNAADIQRELRGTGRHVVLLGREVQQAFAHPPLLIHPQVIGGCTWRQLPHPSGRNFWYNDPDNVKLAELLLEELYVNSKEVEKVQ